MKRHLLYILLLLPGLALAQVPSGGYPYNQRQITRTGWITDSNTVNRQRTDAIRNALNNSLLTRPTKAQNDTYYKPFNYSPNFQIGTVTILPYGSTPTASFRGTGDVPILDLGLVAGPPGSASGTVGSVNGIAPNNAGNVPLTSDNVPGGSTNLYALSAEFGKSIRRTQANLTGSADASTYVQGLTNTSGRVYLTGTIRLDNQVVPGADDLEIEGDATVVLSPGVGQAFNLQGRKNVKISGLKFVKAPGNNEDPLAVLIQQSRNIVFEKNICTGVNGPSTYRPAYNTVDSTKLCYDIFVLNNTITGTNGGPWGGAVTTQYTIGGVVSGNRIDDTKHGVLVWGGNSNPASGENNSDGSAPKWAKNITVTGNIVTRANRFAPDGGSIWSSMGENITITGNVGLWAGDVIYDDEAGLNNTFTGNVGKYARNAAMSVFYNSVNTQFLGNIITQGPNDGYGFNAYGSMASTGTKLLGGSITTTSTTKEAVHTEDGMQNNFTVGGGLSINSAYRAMTLQKVRGATISGPLSITTAALATDGRAYGIYVQGGDRINLSGVSMFYSGTATAGAVLFSDGASGALTNSAIENIIAPNFPGGIRNDQFAGGTGNRFTNNRVSQTANVNGNLQQSGNRNAAGVLVDGSPENGRLTFTTYALMTAAMTNYAYPVRVLVLHDEYNGLLLNGQYTPLYYDYDPATGLDPDTL